MNSSGKGRRFRYRFRVNFLTAVSDTVHLEALAGFQEFIRGFAASEPCEKKFLMVDAYQTAKSFVQAKQLARQNGDALFKHTSDETIRMWKIHNGSSLHDKRASRD